MPGTELWSSGRATSIAATLVLIIFGVFGIVARKRVNRWLLVLSPLVPYLLLFALPSDRVTLSEIVSAALSSVALYVFLFRVRANREYFNDRDVGT